MSDGRNLKSDIYNLNLNIYLNMYSYLILQHLNMETTFFLGSEVFMFEIYVKL